MLHEPLDPAQKQFRLIRLRSRKRTADQPVNKLFEYPPVECNLYRTSIGQKPVYQALSYTWGPEHDTLPITINGEEVLVTRNLRVALENVREEDEDVVLWVDAICINQRDTAEKGVQVSQMKDIFTNARQTIVWLGPATEYSDIIIAELSRIGEDLVQRRVRDMMFDMAATKDTKLCETLEQSVKENMADYIEDYFRRGAHFRFLIFEFAYLLGRDYWSRVWVIQEFVLSAKLQIRCGRSTILFEHFHATFMFLVLVRTEFAIRLSQTLGKDDEYEANNEIHMSVFMHEGLTRHNAAPMFALRKNYLASGLANQDTAFNLAALMTSTQMNGDSNATEQRDRIYALLGLANDNHILELKPEYEEAVSCEAVFTAAARAMLTTGHVDLLAFSQLWIDRGERSPAQRMTGLPSWVPDWRVKILDPRGGKLWQTCFRASGKLTFHKPIFFQTGLPKELIKLLGFRIDVVEALADEWWTEGPVTFQNYRTYLSDVEELCKKSDAKMKDTGIEVYPKPYDRQGARVVVPIAGQQVYSMGFAGPITTTAQESYELVQADIETQSRREPRTFGLQLREDYYIRMKEQRFRRPFLSANGFVGLVPRNSRPGDLIVVFLGSKFIYALREDQDGACSLIGEAYVHGIMSGELSDTEPVVEDFVLK
jgi:hypothetical protein